MGLITLCIAIVHPEGAQQITAENSKHLGSAHHVPGTILGALHRLIDLILTTPL